MHEYGHKCDQCQPYVPADKHTETKMDLFGWPLLALAGICLMVALGCGLERLLP